MKKTLLFLVAGFFFLNNLPAQKPIEQKEIRLVQYMPNIPFPYKMKNWKDIATKQDRLFYDFNAKGQNLPLIWWDDSQVNFPFRTFGLPSYVAYIIHSGFISGYQNRYGDNLKPPTNVYHRMTA